MEYIKGIIKTFIYVLGGIVISAATFITIVIPEAQLNVYLLWQIISMAAVCSLGSFIYYSKREYSKKQMKIRIAAHYLYINLVVLGGAILWGWMDTGVIMEIIFLMILIAVVYIAVCLVMFQKEEKIAENLNQRLRKFHAQDEKDEL